VNFIPRDEETMVESVQERVVAMVDDLAFDLSLSPS
jgi:hypothetical protein